MDCCDTKYKYSNCIKVKSLTDYLKWYVPKTCYKAIFREQASIFSRLGFDGLFFGRLDWRDKDTRIQNQTMEVIWKAGHYEEDNLFTGVLYNYYFPPSYFCWDLLCNDEPIMDNPTLHDYNLGQNFGRISIKFYRKPFFPKLQVEFCQSLTSKIFSLTCGEFTFHALMALPLNA